MEKPVRSASTDATSGGRQSAPTIGEVRNETEKAQPSPKVPQSVTPKLPPPTAGKQQQQNGSQTEMEVVQTWENTVQNQSQPRQSPAPPPIIFKTGRAATTAGTSAQRKRSRMTEEGGQGQGESGNVTKIQEYVELMNAYIESLKTGHRGNACMVRIQMIDCMKGILSETTSLLTKLVNIQDLQISYHKTEKEMKGKIITLQEENSCIKQQVIDLQAKGLRKEQEEKVEMPPTYAQMVNKPSLMNLITGRQMPLPHIAQGIKHAPAECIIMFKAAEKGEMATKSEQETFRKEIKQALGEEESKRISAIRPTRYGGHTLIFYNKGSRNKAYEKLRQNERERGIDDDETCLVAPAKRVAKVVCKQVPSDTTIEQIKQDMFGQHNPALQLVENEHRTRRIYRTRLGLIFELSSQEMAAVQSQDWRIRCDVGREMRVEEFISLQQCYACSKFGHSAIECKAEKEKCRLCGKEGHAGKDCPEKNNKDSWRCANCQTMNVQKNMNLDVKHAAAQLHKCPVAIQQRNIRKIQLASTGVYTTPIQKGDDILREKTTESVIQRSGVRGAETEQNNRTGRRNNRSQSVRRNFAQTQRPGDRQRRGNIQERGNEVKQSREANPCVQRAIRIPRPRSTDGWRVAGRREERKSDSSGRGRGSVRQERESNSQQMNIEDETEMQTPDELIFNDYEE